MYPNKRAFTLIELLVVVLIIGILASVAVPQYQKAVLKSRLTQAIVFAKSIHEAQEAYYLANGRYASSWASLDLDIVCPQDMICEINSSKTDLNLNGDVSIVYINNHVYTADEDRFEWNGKLYCWARVNTREEQVCQSMGTKLTYSNTQTANRYSLN